MDAEERRALELHRRGDFAGAADVLERRARTMMRLHGNDSPQAVLAWEVVAHELRNSDRCPRAIEIAEMVLREKESVVGPRHRSLLEPLIILASCTQRLGKLPEAERFAARCTKIANENFRAPNLDRVHVANLDAGIRTDRGDYKAARSIFEGALAEARRLPRDPAADDAIASLLSNLATVCLYAGDFRCARDNAEEAVAQSVRSHGRDHPHVATKLHNEATVLFQMRDYVHAASRLMNAIRISESTVGPTSAAVADHLRELGAVFTAMGSYDEARKALMRALEILERPDTTAPADAAKTLGALGVLADREGRYGDALNYHQRCLKLHRAIYRDGHPEIASSVANVGLAFSRLARFEEAIPVLQEALAMDIENHGSVHLDTATSYANLAGAYWELGRTTEAFAALTKALEIQERVIPGLFAAGVESQRSNFKQFSEGPFIAALMIAAQHPDDPAIVQRAFRLLAQRKGWALDTFATFERTWSSSPRPEVRRQWRALQQARSDLARARLVASNERTDESALLAENVVGNAERALLRESPPQTRGLGPAEVSPEGLARRLPRNALFLDFVKIWDRRAGANRWDAPHYIVFGLSSEGDVWVHDLGTATPIDTEVAELNRRIGMQSPQDDLIEASLMKLRQLVLDPIEQRLLQRDWLVIAPDAELGFIPFAALPQRTGRYLIEDKTISYVSSARDLSRVVHAARPELDGVVVAHPTYDVPARQKPGSRRLTLKELPGTAAEARIVQEAFSGRVEVLADAQATETALARLPSTRVLHLATHGLFGLGSKGSATDDFDAMTQSGLALVGANDYLSAESSDDGILTAWEFLGLDLSGTDLIVFSACDSAVGRVSRGEGLVGLRRAAAVAGIHGVLAALWYVYDRETVAFMKDFYVAYAAGEAPAVAVRRSQRSSIDRLRASRDGQAPPRIWGAFVLQEHGGW